MRAQIEAMKSMNSGRVLTAMKTPDRIPSVARRNHLTEYQGVSDGSLMSRSSWMQFIESTEPSSARAIRACGDYGFADRIITSGPFPQKQKARHSERRPVFERVSSSLPRSCREARHRFEEEVGFALVPLREKKWPVECLTTASSSGQFFQNGSVAD